MTVPKRALSAKPFSTGELQKAGIFQVGVLIFASTRPFLKKGVILLIEPLRWISTRCRKREPPVSKRDKSTRRAFLYSP